MAVCTGVGLMQAKALGDVLVVGLIPDSEILRCKGPPVLNERERYLLVDAVKWVDEVVKGDTGHSTQQCILMRCGAGSGHTASTMGSMLLVAVRSCSVHVGDPWHPGRRCSPSVL